MMKLLITEYFLFLFVSYWFIIKNVFSTTCVTYQLLKMSFLSVSYWIFYPIFRALLVNPNRAGLLDVAWERGGGWISPHLLDHLKTLWKTKKNFDFPKVHNELGKVTKFGSFTTLFSWRNGRLKIVWADSAPHPPQ